MINREDDKLTFILPAPSVTRQETGILWYEITVFESESRFFIVAFDDTTWKKVSEAEIILINGKSSRTILSKGDIIVKIETTISKANDGEPRVLSRINGYNVDVFSLAKGTEATLAGFTLGLNEVERKLLEHWSLIAEAVSALAEISAATSPTNSWGSTACALLTAGVVLTSVGCGIAAEAAVATGGVGIVPALTSCGSALASAALHEEQCH